VMRVGPGSCGWEVPGCAAASRWAPCGTSSSVLCRGCSPSCSSAHLVLTAAWGRHLPQENKRRVHAPGSRANR
jgi:hypothetical protein